MGGGVCIACELSQWCRHQSQWHDRELCATDTKWHLKAGQAEARKDILRQATKPM